MSDLVSEHSPFTHDAGFDLPSPGQPRASVPSAPRRSSTGRISRLAPFSLVCFFIVVNLHLLEVDTTSDTLYPLSIARDVVEHRLRLRGWVFPPGLFLFPDTLVTSILYAPGHNLRLAYFGSCVVFGGWFAVLARVMVRRLGSGLSPAVQRWVWASGMALLCSASLVNKGLFLLLQMVLCGAFHDGALLVSLTVVLLVSSPSERRRGLVQLIALLLLGLGTMSDLLVLPEAIAPGLAMLWFRRRNGAKSGTLRAWLVVLVLGPMAGLLGQQLLAHSGFTLSSGGRPHPSIVGLGRFVRDMATFAYGYPVWSAAFVVGVAAVARLVLVAGRNAPSNPSGCAEGVSARCLLWGLGTMVAVSTGATAVAGYLYTDHVRRILPLLVLPLLLAPLAVAHALYRNRRQRTGTWIVLCGVCVSASVGVGISTTTRGTLGWLIPEIPYYAHQRCLDDLHRNGTIGSGIGDYWTARLFTETSRSGVVIAPVGADGRFSEGISNPDIVLAPASNPHGIAAGPFNFVLPNRLDATTMERFVGAPDRRLSCAGLAVWVYENGRLGGQLSRMQRDARGNPGVRLQG